MSNPLNQAIVKRSFVTTATFATIPSEETRKALMSYGFQYDGRSGNWYRSQREASIVNEDSVANLVAV